MAPGKRPDEIVTQPGDASPSSTSAHSEKIISKLAALNGISNDEKSSMISIFEDSSGQIDWVSLDSLLNSLREGEGKVMLSLAKRCRNVSQAIKEDSKGVNIPLDSVIMSKSKLQVYLPDRLEAYADYGLITELLRYKLNTPGVELLRSKEDLALPNEEGINFFIMGYITELLSTQKIEKISYNKDSKYLIGRNCARVKLLTMVIDQNKVPNKFIKIPSRYLGGTKDFEKPEIDRILSATIKNNLIDTVKELLDNLTRHTINVRRDEVLRKIGSNLFMPVSEFLHVFERKTSKTTGKGKKKRTVSESIKPTKPSQLATVAPWEQESIRELYEGPWNELKLFIEEYENTPGMNRSYKNLGDKLTKIIEQQWSSKQEVLRRTKIRMKMSNLPDSAPLWQKLNEVRNTLTSLSSLEEAYRTNWYDMLNPYILLPRENILVEGDFQKNFTSAHRDKELDKLYPETDRLLSAYDILMVSEGLLEEGPPETTD